MTATPSFVLSGPGGTLAAHGVHTPYPDIAAGQAALRSGAVPILMGALPFDVSKPAALMAPQSHRFSDELPSWPVTPLPKMRIAAAVPPAEAHGQRIRRALTVLRDPDSALHKVVLARARLRESSTTALDLALALHPTAAVGGVPTDAATAMIAELEGDRGFYASAAGWCDTDGDGRWVVSIRCAVLSADRRDAYAYSGGGIVADSDVDDEIDETTTKFRTILVALGAAS
jgi:isochorismate synthase EntC